MTRNRWILLVGLLLLGILATWLWWARPTTVDMATYAPADALLYLEANRPSDIVEALAGTDVWKTNQNILGASPLPSNTWLAAFVKWTGIGPIQSVILARAQVAAVVTELGTVEEGEELKIKPEVAVLIETHTAESRIRTPVLQALTTFAEKMYGRPTSRQTTIDGVEFMEWSSPDGSRQVVGAIVGSLVVVGNSEHAVQNCLAVSFGHRRSLKDDPELARMRRQLGGDRGLAFGYVPAGNSARLLAVGIPLLLGRAPADADLQNFIAKGAAKVFGSLGWVSRTYQGGIEDRYSITLQPAIVTGLKPNFAPANISSQMQRVLPHDVYSFTSYKFANPAATWVSMKTAVASQVDTLSAIVFSTLFKAALVTYGIDDPETFLQAVEGELLTVRLDENAERSILIAPIKDEAALHTFVKNKMQLSRRTDATARAELFEDPQGEFAASFQGRFLILGAPADVRNYTQSRQTNPSPLTEQQLKKLTFFFSSSTSANVVTYTNDSGRVRSFISTIVVAMGKSIRPPSDIDEMIAGVPYSVTETTLRDEGIERITRSPVGQFGTLLPLLMPEQPGAATR